METVTHSNNSIVLYMSKRTAALLCVVNAIILVTLLAGFSLSQNYPIHEGRSDKLLKQITTEKDKDISREKLIKILTIESNYEKAKNKADASTKKLLQSTSKELIILILFQTAILIWAYKKGQ